MCTYFHTFSYICSDIYILVCIHTYVHILYTNVHFLMYTYHHQDHIEPRGWMRQLLLKISDHIFRTQTIEIRSWNLESCSPRMMPARRCLCFQRWNVDKYMHYCMNSYTYMHIHIYAYIYI